MLRRMLAIGLIALSVVACGGSTATPSPSAAASVAPTLTPTLTPTEQPTTAPTTMTAICNAIGVRKTPSTTGGLVARVNNGATVHAVNTVTGDAYTVGACGTGGTTWLEIDEINGKTVQSMYGVPSVYSAAGLFR
jgi:hypothetical protein